MGILRIRGQIELAQFWPDGSADADTTKIKLEVGSNSFAYADDGKKFRTTKAFFGAEIRGRSRKAVIDAQNRITIRLQGIDAPELHYRASGIPHKSGISDAKRKKFNAANKERRQHWAESATLALADKLTNFGDETVKCEFLSFVDRPTDVCDTYGRFVGNIRVGTRFNLDINLWLVEEGWVVPSFYNSMSEDEIDAILVAAKKGKTKKRLWKDLSVDTSKFEEKLLYRKKGPAEPIGDDAGPVLMPKIYRRQVAFRAQKTAGIVDGSFGDYLEQQKSDRWIELEDYLVNGLASADQRTLDTMLKGKKLRLGPDDVVFTESQSKLVNKNGKLIDKF